MCSSALPDEASDQPSFGDIAVAGHQRWSEGGPWRVAQVVRDKNVIKPASGTRECKCRQKMVTRQLGPGMFQQYTTQEVLPHRGPNHHRTRHAMQVQGQDYY